MDAGFVKEAAPGTFAATAEAASTATLADLASLAETGDNLARGAARDIADNIRLVSVCMAALPDMLAGALLTQYTLCSCACMHGHRCEHLLCLLPGTRHLLKTSACTATWGILYTAPQ